MTVSPRTETAAISRYLDYLASQKRSSRGLSPEQAQAKIEKLQAEIDECSDPLHRVALIQHRLDVERQATTTIDGPEDLEAAFVTYAGAFSARKGIGWSAFRAVAVPAAVLRAAGVLPGS